MIIGRARHLLLITSIILPTTAFKASSSTVLTEAEYDTLANSTPGAIKTFAAATVDEGSIDAAIVEFGSIDSDVLRATIGQGATVTGGLTAINNLLDPSVSPENLTTATTNVSNLLGVGGTNLLADATALKNAIDPTAANVQAAVTSVQTKVGVTGANLLVDVTTINTTVDATAADVQTAVTNVRNKLGGTGADLQTRASDIQATIGQGGASVSTDLTSLLTGTMNITGATTDLTVAIQAVKTRLFNKLDASTFGAGGLTANSSLEALIARLEAAADIT